MHIAAHQRKKRRKLKARRKSQQSAAAAKTKSGIVIGVMAWLRNGVGSLRRKKKKAARAKYRKLAARRVILSKANGAALSAWRISGYLAAAAKAAS